MWFFQEYPIISGLIFSIILGTPSGLAVIWGIREAEEPPAKNKDRWDDEWDL